jgi:hypothetical protein
VPMYRYDAQRTNLNGIRNLQNEAKLTARKREAQ